MSAPRLAYKFLARGAIGPVSRVRWPLPSPGGAGPWLAADAPLAVCRSGVHACLKDQLAFWLHEELWQVELEGELRSGLDCVVSPRGRLLARVDAWSESGGAHRFAAAVRDHATALIDERPPAERDAFLGYVADATWHVEHGQLESPALAALCASMAVAKLSESLGLGSLEEAYRRERAWQSEWIVDQMGLS